MIATGGGGGGGGAMFNHDHGFLGDKYQIPTLLLSGSSDIQ